MYVYRTFVALEQEVRCGKRLCARLRGIRRIRRRDRVKRCAAELSGEGRTLFGRKFLILRSGSAILTDLVLRRRRNG